MTDILAETDLARLGYFGMSYGATATGSAIQADERAIAAVNFGTHWTSDLLATKVEARSVDISYVKEWAQSR